MRKGRQSWVFERYPIIRSAATVVGPFEGQGPLGKDFDIVHGDPRINEPSWEKAERRMMEEACTLAIENAKITKENVDFHVGGDLMNQLTSSSFAARTLSIPHIGVFGACSTAMESLALAALLVNSQAALTVLAGTCSHNATAEKQFRYPTEYGSQKPPTAQYTVTGAGASIVSAEGEGPVVTAATIGRVIDMGITDPFNMGAAMAPAAVDTITAHFRDMECGASHYDLIVTGDLAKVGHDIAYALLEKHQIEIPRDKFIDCGMLIYDPVQQQVQSGGSGCGCSAVVTYGHLLRRLKEGQWQRILIVGTGSLHSPITFQQGETIPSIAHAVVIERGKPRIGGAP